MAKVLVVAAIAAVITGWIAYERGSDFNTPQARADRAAAVLDATMSGKPTPTFTQPWPEKHPALFGGAVGLVVFALGTLVIIAQNTSPDHRVTRDSGEHVKPPATSE